MMLLQRLCQNRFIIRFIYILAAITFVAYILCLLSIKFWHDDYQVKAKWLRSHRYFYYDTTKEEPRDSTQACQIPVIHPFDSSIIRHVHQSPTVTCSGTSQYPLTYISDEGILRLKQPLLVEKYRYLWPLMSCRYAEVLRDASDPAKDTFKMGASKIFINSVNVSHIDFVRVTCNIFRFIPIYDYIHAHIRDFERKVIGVGSADIKYNVLLFGIDSLSRQNAMRQLPKTFSFVKDVMKNEILKGYMKVGGNTFPNLATLLTGYQPYDERERFSSLEGYLKPHDPWPFIWKNFSRIGYRTLFAEDVPNFNAFHYMGGGFKEQPTDHYLRTYWTAIDDSLFSTSAQYCYKEASKFLLHMNYIKSFVKRRKGPFWALSYMTEICHDSVNSVGVADDTLLQFFSELFTEGYFNDTVVIFFSDHGNRMDSIRQTSIGSIEDNMPLFSIYIPEKLRESHPEAMKNLRLNNLRLTSARDAYCTLIDILKLSEDKSYKLGGFRTGHGQSLFGKISPHRNCSSAAINLEYCMCHSMTAGQEDNPYVRKASEFMVDRINQLLKSKGETASSCAILTLHEVKSAISLEMKETRMEEKHFRIKFEVLPSYGLFEGIVEVKSSNTSEIKILGEIERVNKYGNQPRCITDRVLRIYCYCP